MTSAAVPFTGTAPARRNAEMGLAVAVVFIIGLLIVPLPPFLLDLFLATSIGLSVVVLLTTSSHFRARRRPA